MSSAGSFDPDGTLTSYVWNFGDGNIGSGQAATHIYSDPGIYTIILTVTDNDRATASDSTFVTVEVPNQGPTANFNYSCTSLSCTFSDTSSDVDGSIASRTWSFGDGAGATTQTASHTYSAGGTYAVTLTVTDDDGATDSTQKSVTLTTSGDVTLTVGATDPGAYGNNFGSNQHATELVASFQGTGL